MSGSRRFVFSPTTTGNDIFSAACAARINNLRAGGNAYDTVISIAASFSSSSGTADVHIVSYDRERSDVVARISFQLSADPNLRSASDGASGRYLSNGIVRIMIFGAADPTIDQYILLTNKNATDVIISVVPSEQQTYGAY